MNKKHRACDGSAILPQHEEAGCFYLNYCWILFQQNDKLWSRQESCGARSCIHRTRRIALRRQQWTDGVTCLRSASVNFRPHSAAARRQLKENVAETERRWPFVIHNCVMLHLKCHQTPGCDETHERGGAKLGEKTDYLVHEWSAILNTKNFIKKSEIICLFR